MAIVEIGGTGRNSARVADVRILAQKVQQPSDTEAVISTNIITAAESGTRFILNSATGFVSTLPAVEAGYPPDFR